MEKSDKCSLMILINLDSKALTIHTDSYRAEPKFPDAN
jgi:hypothetical protein